MQHTMRGSVTIKNGHYHYNFMSSETDISYTCICSEQDLQRQVSLAKSQLRELRMSNETNQAKLLDHTQRQGDLLNQLICQNLYLTDL